MKNNGNNKIFKLKNSQTISRYQIPFQIDSIHVRQQIGHQQFHLYLKHG